MAYVTLGVEARRPTLAEARTEVNATVERLLALTRELKIEPKFVDSTRLQVQPDYRWDEKSSSQVLLGYVVSRQVDVELHDLDRLGTLLEKSVSAGVNQVGGARLDSSRRKELERAALTQAVDDARLNADALARAAGAKLGPVQSLSTTGTMPVPMYLERAMSVAAAPMADAAETELPVVRDEIHGQRERAVRAAGALSGILNYSVFRCTGLLVIKIQNYC